MLAPAERALEKIKLFTLVSRCLYPARANEAADERVLRSASFMYVRIPDRLQKYAYAHYRYLGICDGVLQYES